tara:strand:+ start:403 stop:687 length:285 start_codon:yes stop_codon:yes gene_type:complete
LKLFFAPNSGIPTPEFLRLAQSSSCETPSQVNFGEIKGLARVKRAVQIAAAGGYNLLMIGPPGRGKTLLANLLIALLPFMFEDEALEVSSHQVC